MIGFVKFALVLAVSLALFALGYFLTAAALPVTPIGPADKNTPKESTGVELLDWNLGAVANESLWDRIGPLFVPIEQGELEAYREFLLELPVPNACPVLLDINGFPHGDVKLVFLDIEERDWYRYFFRAYPHLL